VVNEGEDYFGFVARSNSVYDAPHIDSLADPGAQRLASRLAALPVPSSLDSPRPDTGVQESSARVDASEAWSVVPDAGVTQEDEDNGFEFAPDADIPVEESVASSSLPLDATEPHTQPPPALHVVVERPDSYLALLMSPTCDSPSAQGTHIENPDTREAAPAQASTKGQVSAEDGAGPRRAKKTHRCAFEGCGANLSSQEYCKYHGGQKTHRRCTIPGCDSRSCSGGRCAKHGGGPRCRIELCGRAATSNQLCHAHLPCKIPGCTSKTRTRGLCRAHGGGTMCSVHDCTSLAARRGWCRLHCLDQCAYPQCLRTPGPTGLCTSHNGCEL
jgi:hypothetical protein